MDRLDGRIRDFGEQRDFLIHDLEDIYRGANYYRNDDNITDKMRRRSVRMLVQIDAALADYEAEQRKGGKASKSAGERKASHLRSNPQHHCILTRPFAGIAIQPLEQAGHTNA
jgi:hypothetical protein